MQNLFQNVTGAVLNSVVASNIWQANLSGSLSVSGGSIVKNGLVVASPASFVSGDFLSIRVTASSLENTAVHAVYQINGDPGTFSVATVNNNEYEYQFTLTDVGNVARSAPIDSNELNLYRLSAPVTVSVPSVFSATIVKNGIPVGQTTTVVNGDKLKLRLTTPASALYQVKVPLFVGSYYDDFILTTVAIDQSPDRFTFTDVTGATEGSTVLSNLITIAGIDTGASVTATIANGILVKNGTDVGSSTSVSLGDTLRAKVTASALSLGAVCAVVTIGDIQAAFNVVTRELSDYYYTLAANKDKTQFEQTFTPDLAANRLVKLDTGGVFTAYSFTAPTNTEDQTDHIFLASYYEDAVYVMGTNGTTLRKITLPAGSKPYSGGYSPRSSPADTVAKKYFACNGTDKVVEVDPATYTVTRTFSLAVGAKPMGVGADETNIFVANYGLGTVSTIDIATGIVSNINVSGTPYELAVPEQETGAFWVTKHQENTVEKWSNGVRSLQVTVGGRPTGVCLNSNHVFVANSYDNTVSKIDKATGVIISTYDTLSCPMYVQATDTYLYVGHFGTSKIQRITLATGVATTYSDTGRHFGIGLDASGNLWIARLYNNAPAFVGAADRISPVSAISFTDVALNSLSNISFVVSGTDDHPKLLSVPALSGVQVKIDGVAVATPCVVNGSQVEITVASSPKYYDTVTLIAYISDTAITATVRTEPNLIPDTLYFSNVFNVEVNAVILSNQVTIAGLTAGFSTQLLYDNANGVLIINGIEKTASENVVNGDTVQLQSVVQGPYGTANTYNVRAQGTVVGSYKVVTMVLGGAIHGPAWSEYEHTIDSGVKFQEQVTLSEQILLPEIAPFTVSLLPLDSGGGFALYGELREAEAGLPVAVKGTIVTSTPPVSTFGSSTTYSSDSLVDTLLSSPTLLHADKVESVFWPSVYAQPGMAPSYFVALSVHLVPFAAAEGFVFPTNNRHWTGVEFTTYSVSTTSVATEFTIDSIGVMHVSTEFNTYSPSYTDVVTDTLYIGRSWYEFGTDIVFHPNHNICTVDPKLVADVTYHFTFEMPMSYTAATRSYVDSNLSVATKLDISTIEIVLNEPRLVVGNVYEIDLSRPQHKPDAVYAIAAPSAKLNQPNQHLVNIVHAALAPYSVQGDTEDADTCEQLGGFDTQALAIADCQAAGNSVCNAVLINGCWTWSTPKDTNISCPIPPDADIPLVGYISGG